MLLNVPSLNLFSSFCNLNIMYKVTVCQSRQKKISHIKSTFMLNYPVLIFSSLIYNISQRRDKYTTALSQSGTPSIGLKSSQLMGVKEKYPGVILCNKWWNVRGDQMPVWWCKWSRQTDSFGRAPLRSGGLWEESRGSQSCKLKLA